MNPADQIISQYFNQDSKQPANPADNIVNSFFAKQEAKPHPLDDTYVAKAKADQGDQSYNGYCEAFVEKAAGLPNMGQTASEAWNNFRQKGMATSGNIGQAPKGALIYFAPDSSNWGDGHVGFADGQGNLTSATSQGVQTMPIKQWQKQTGQQGLGYVMPN